MIVATVLALAAAASRLRKANAVAQTAKPRK